MSTFEQGKSCLQVSSSLGDNALLLSSFNGREEISSPFQFTLAIISTSESVDLSKLLGKNISWCYSPKGDNSGQWFDGRVYSVSQGASGAYNIRNATIEVVSWFSLLKETKHRNVFIEKNIKDITQEILGKYPDAAFELNLTETYQPFTCMVQYEQSDHDFLSWLWETHGIFYFYKFEKNKHTMVIADSSAAFKDTKTKGIEFLQNSGNYGALTSWQHGYKWVNGKATVNDYNFEKPSSSLVSKASASVSIPGNSNYEKYIYPGGYQVSADGKKASELVIGASDTLYETVTGSSTLTGFNSGLKFKIEKHPISSEAGKTYIFMAVSHKGNATSNPSYENNFQCFPEKVKFRPSTNTLRPLIPGVHTAVVAGPSGKEIFTDKYGRIKIQFIWDTEKKGSYWVRVSQFLAGKNFGFFSLPRVGEEVLIAFEEGDPCRPVVVGSLYNGEQLTPYKLPDEALFSGLKSKSSPKGGAEDFNELRFEDNKGKELVFIQANKDMKTVIKNDNTIEITKNCSTTVSEGNTLLEIKKGYRQSKIYGDDKLTISDGGLTVNIEKGKRETTIKDTDTLTVQSNRETTIKGNDTLTLQSGNLEFNVESGTYATKSPKSIALTVGSSSLKIESSSIVLTVGSTSIKLESSGITLTGPKVSIQGSSQVSIQGAMVTISGDTQAEIKAAQVNISGSAMCQVKGAITMVG